MAQESRAIRPSPPVPRPATSGGSAQPAVDRRARSRRWKLPGTTV